MDIHDILNDIELPGETCCSDAELSELVQFCDEKALTGELAFEWEGGNDSGAFTLKHNDDEIETYCRDSLPVANKLADLLAARLEYYGFDGNFYTSGRLVYSKEDKCFYGEDNYSTTDSETLTCDIPVKLPTGLWFDSVRITMEGGRYDSYGINVDIIVNNGPFTEAHEAAAKRISTDIENCLGTVFENIENFEGVMEDLRFTKGEFERNGDSLTAKITELNYSYEDSEVKDISISIID